MINDGTLVSSQILTIGAINAALVFGLLTLYRFYGEAPLFLRGVWWHGLLARLAMALLAGGFAMLTASPPMITARRPCSLSMRGCSPCGILNWR